MAEKIEEKCYTTFNKIFAELMDLIKGKVVGTDDFIEFNILDEKSRLAYSIDTNGLLTSAGPYVYKYRKSVMLMDENTLLKKDYAEDDVDHEATDIIPRVKSAWKKFSVAEKNKAFGLLLDLCIAYGEHLQLISKD